MLANISLGQILWLHKNKLNLSHLKYIESILSGEEVPTSTLLTHLEKQGVVFKGEVTDYGKEIYETFKSIPPDVKIIKRKPKVEPQDPIFDKWWDNYPRTTSHSGFVGTRNLRVKKDVCRTLFRQIIEEGKYTLAQLIEAVNREVNARKTESVSTGKNEMHYMKGTESYLRSRQFENYMNDETKKKGGFTI